MNLYLTYLTKEDFIKEIDLLKRFYQENKEIKRVEVKIIKTGKSTFLYFDLNSMGDSEESAVLQNNFFKDNDKITCKINIEYDIDYDPELLLALEAFPIITNKWFEEVEKINQIKLLHIFEKLKFTNVCKTILSSISKSDLINESFSNTLLDILNVTEFKEQKNPNYELYKKLLDTIDYFKSKKAFTDVKNIQAKIDKLPGTGIKGFIEASKCFISFYIYENKIKSFYKKFSNVIRKYDYVFIIGVILVIYLILQAKYLKDSKDNDLKLANLENEKNKCLKDSQVKDLKLSNLEKELYRLYEAKKSNIDTTVKVQFEYIILAMILLLL